MSEAQAPAQSAESGVDRAAAMLGASEQPEKTNIVKSIAENIRNRGRAAIPGTAQESSNADTTAESPNADTSISNGQDQKEDKSEPPKEPEDKGLSLRHAKALKDLSRAQTEARTHSQALEALKKEHETLKSSFAENPLRALEKATGRTFGEIMKDAAQGKYDLKNVDPEISAELKEIRAWREEQKKQQEQQATAAQRSADLKLCTDFLSGRAEEFPGLAALDPAHSGESLMEAAYARLKETGEQPDLAEIAKEAETQLLTGLKQVLTNQKLIALARKDPELTAVFGAAKPAAAGKTVNPLGNKDVSETPRTEKPKSSQDDDSAMLARWEQAKKTGGIRLR